MEEYGDKRREKKGNLEENVRKQEGEKRKLGKEERGGNTRLNKIEKGNWRGKLGEREKGSVKERGKLGNNVGKMEEGKRKLGKGEGGGKTNLHIGEKEIKIGKLGGKEKGSGKGEKEGKAVKEVKRKGKDLVVNGNKAGSLGRREEKGLEKEEREKREKSRKIIKMGNHIEELGEEGERGLAIRLININGFTRIKNVMFEELFFSKGMGVNILCLTETKNTFDKVDISGRLKYHATRRERGGRRGGGLQVIYPDDERIVLDKVENDSSEILELDGTIYGMDIKMVIVYMDTRKNTKGDEANKKIRKKLEKIIENNDRDGLMIMGDFNGHIKWWDGKEDDKNGGMLLEWIQDYGLIMLNMDDRCIGKYTWSRGENKSVIDYMMVNSRVYDKFVGMEIDEEKLIYGDSDHHMMSMYLKMREERECFKKVRWEEVEFYTKDKEALEKMRIELEEEWRLGNIENKQEEERSVVEKANQVLKRKIRRKVGRKKKEKEKVWMTDEIRKGIKERQRINRELRNCVKEDRRKILERKFKDQKHRVGKMVRDGIERYEIELTRQIRMNGGRGKNGEDMWYWINKIRGKEGKVGSGDKIFGEDGKEMDSTEGWEKVVSLFGGIYKTGEEKANPIYGGRWNADSKEDLEKRYEEEKKRGEGGHMEMPLMEIDDLGVELGKLKEGKAAGLNKIKGEVYKELGKSEICKEVMVKGYNKVIRGGEIPGGGTKQGQN